LDFKSFAEPAKTWEHAKDIAAFANAFGGVILVGATDKSGCLVIRGLQSQSAKEVKSIYEGAANLCSPPPNVDVIPIPFGATTLVAVNVDPFADQIVGAPAGTRDKNGNERLNGKAWVFPIRRASQTDFIKPENLPMYTNQAVRRAILLLANIRRDSSKNVVVHCFKPAAHVGAAGTEDLVLTIGGVSVERNYVEVIEHGRFDLHCHVPLTDVFDAWQAKDGQWHVRVRGRLYHLESGNTGRLEYQVLPLMP
jgi:hypothetical protein